MLRYITHSFQLEGSTWSGTDSLLKLRGLVSAGMSEILIVDNLYMAPVMITLAIMLC